MKIKRFFYKILFFIRPIRIRFFFQTSISWLSIQSVIDSCKSQRNIEVQIVVFPFLHSYLFNNISEERKFLVKNKLNFINCEDYNIEQDKPDIIFLQTPYDSTRPQEYSLDTLLKLGSKIAYIPYGLDVGGGINVDYQYNLNVQNKAWKIFTYSEHSKSSFGKHCDSGNKHVIVTGHPKTDAIFNLESLKVDPELTQFIANRLVILWNPHFSVGDVVLWSTWQRFAKFIFAEFKRRQNLVLILRPHPMLFSSLRQNNLLNEEEEKELRKTIKDSKNIILDESTDYLQAFKVSNALMSDGSSLLLEYLPINNPILYLENKDGPGLGEAESAREAFYCASDTQAISEFLNLVEKGKDIKHSNRTECLHKYFFKIDGKAGERIKNYIIDNFTLF